MAREEDQRRVETGGRLIDRTKPVAFFLNGESLLGYRGDTLASALLSNDRLVVGRSRRGGRPRGFWSADAAESCALFEIDEGDGAEPARPGPATPLRPGLKAFAPVPAKDSGWRRMMRPILGVAQKPVQVSPAPGTAERFHFFTDVLVIGAGAAGIAAAKAAAACGARVLLVEQAAHLGGRALVDGGRVRGAAAEDWLAEEIAALEAAPNVVIRPRAQALSLRSEPGAGPQFAIIRERPEPPGPRHRLWRVAARRIVVAAGAAERPMVFADNDAPGVMTASAARDYLSLYGVRAGDRAVLFTNNDDAYRTAIALAEAGAEIPALVDVREAPEGPLPRQARKMGLPLRTGAVVCRAIRDAREGRLEAVEIAALRASGRLGAVERIDCDLLAMSGGWSPALRLFEEAGGAAVWDAAAALRRPDPENPVAAWDDAAAVCAGAANGAFGLGAALADGFAAGGEAAKGAGFKKKRMAAPKAADQAEGPSAPFWFAPAPGEAADGERHFVEPRCDLTLAEIERAARAGAADLSALATAVGAEAPLGEAGRTIAAALLADALKINPESVFKGSTPPGRPDAAVLLAGAPPLSPLRSTPLEGWAAARGGVPEQIGDWRAFACFPRQSGPGGEMEDAEEAAIREIRAARRAVGAHDLSSLRKLLATGAEAGRFLERLLGAGFTPPGPGACRVGLVCDETGRVVADAVAARMDAGEEPEAASYLLQLPARETPGLEARLRTAAAGLTVRMADLTDGWAHVALSGEKSRIVLESLTNMDVSDQGLAPMRWIAGRVAGCPARIFRVARCGGPGFEIAAPAGYGLSLWRDLFEAGRAHGIAAIGTQARDALRIEAGVPEIGREADGTATRADLGAGGAAGESGRWRLVGLRSEDPDEPLPVGALLREGEGGARLGAAAARTEAVGRVTSSCWSPTLGRAVALGLLEGGAERRGQTVHLSTEDRRVLRARVVAPRFLDQAAGDGV